MARAKKGNNQLRDSQHSKVENKSSRESGFPGLEELKAVLLQALIQGPWQCTGDDNTVLSSSPTGNTRAIATFST